MSYKRSSTASEGSTTASTKSSNNNGSKYRPTFSTIGKLQTPDLYKHHADQYQQTSIKIDDMEMILDQERAQNKNESWNKLDKSLKRQKLHAFAEHYGNENSLTVKEIKSLKTFFSENLDKGKLIRTKDVSYNKEMGEIEQVPALVFQSNTRHFSLRNMDNKYVSTLKSMTPRRTVSDLEKMVSETNEKESVAIIEDSMKKDDTDKNDMDKES